MKKKTKDQMKNSGATITSVLVAAALAGIVAAVVAQLLNNQTKVMRTLTLREERENLLKHYRNTLISGWDNTLTNGCSDLYNRDGAVAVPSGGLTVKSEDLYGTSSSADGWWKVEFTCGGKSGSIFAGDKYDTTDGSGLHSETHREVSLTVNFLQDKYPHGATKLNERVEKFYMHQQKRLNLDTDCSQESQLSRRNTFKPDTDAASALIGGADNFALYKGTGAVIQYDFNTNYVKCSQVPLVRPPDDLCEDDAAIIGFWGTMEGGTGYPYLDGKYVCSHDGGDSSTPPPGGTYHPKTDPLLPDRLITVWRGEDGNDKHLGNFGTDGCQRDSDTTNHTYVSFIDGKGTAFCQLNKHLIEEGVSCDGAYPHPDVPAASHRSFKDPTHEVWGQSHGAADKGYADAEIKFEKDLRQLVAAQSPSCLPFCPPLPATNAGIFSREKYDSCWTLGKGGLREFYDFDDSRGDAGQFHQPESDGHKCSLPGHVKGANPGPGPKGGDCTDPDADAWKGDPGVITWNRISP